MSRRISAVVVYPQVTWFAGPGGPAQFAPTAGWARTEWARLVDVAGRTWFAGGEGVVAVHAAAGVPAAVRADMVREFVDQLTATGWSTTRAGQETGWFTCLPKDKSKGMVMFAVLPWVNQGRTPVVGLGEPAPVIAHAFARYHELTGAPWRGTGGLSGTGAIRGLHDAKGREPLWRWDQAPTEIVGRSYELLASHTMVDPVPDGGDWVHHWDVRAMYLAAAAAAELGPWAPEPRGKQSFDPGRPGYWRVSRDHLHQALRADRQRLIARAQNPTRYVWLTTPAMVYLSELGDVPEVYDAFLADRQSRILREWAERLRDARHKAEFGELPAVKDTYARTVGMLKKPGGRIYRPDWRDHILDVAKTSLLRKVDRAGVRVLHYNVDSIHVQSTEKDPPEKWFLDHGRIGGMRYEKTITVDEYITTYGKAK